MSGKCPYRIGFQRCHGERAGMRQRRDCARLTHRGWCRATACLARGVRPLHRSTFIASPIYGRAHRCRLLSHPVEIEPIRKIVMIRAVLACCVLLVAFLIAGCGEEDRIESYFDRGKSLYEEGDLVKARLEFKNVLQIDPKHAQAWFMLAQIEEKEQNWRKAFGAYSKAAEFDPGNTEARVKRAALLLVGGKAEEALAEAESVLAADPENADALTVCAMIRMRQGDTDSAVADATNALEQVADHRGALAVLARIRIDGGDLGAARTLLETALESDPDALPLRLLLITVYEKLGESEQVLAALEWLAASHPRELAYHVQLANYLRLRGETDAAEEALRAAVAANPLEPRAKLVLVEFLAKARGFDAAEQELRRLIDADPDAYALRFALAKLYRSAAKLGEAESAYREIIELAGSDPQALRARTQLAGLLLAADRAEEAEALAAEVLAEDARDADALLVRAAIALRRDDPERAISDLRALLRDTQDSVAALRLLAQAHAQKQDMALAQDALEKAIEMAPSDPAAYLQLANLRAQNGDMDGALMVLERLLAQAPENTAAQIAMARIRLGQQDIDALNRTAQRVLGSRPEHGLGYYLKGIVLQRQGKLDASVEQFETALEKAPGAPEPLVALARSHLALDQPDKAEQYLRQLLADDPSNIMAINLLGEIYFASKRFAEAREQYAEAILVRPSSPLAYVRMAALQVREGNSAAALKTLQSGVDATERNGFLLLQLGMWLQEANRYDEAAVLYEEVLQRNPQADAAVNNLAMLLVDHRANQPESLSRALELVQRFEGSEQPAYLDTLGWVQFKNGRLEQAVRNLEAAMEKIGQSPEFQYHLGMAYLEHGRMDEAKKQLSGALEADQPFPGKDDARRALEKLAESESNGSAPLPPITSPLV